MTNVLVQSNDAEIRAQSALGSSPIPALRGVRVEQDGDSLVLTGRVNTFYIKQMAQEIVRNAARNLLVINQIEVT